jgi:hypothetical protein
MEDGAEVVHVSAKDFCHETSTRGLAALPLVPTCGTLASSSVVSKLEVIFQNSFANGSDVVFVLSKCPIGKKLYTKICAMERETKSIKRYTYNYAALALEKTTSPWPRQIVNI